MNNRVWLITGISSGLGQHLAAAALAHGDRVVGTFRQAAQAAAFTQQHPEQALGLVLDVTQTAHIESVVQQALARWGRLDVLINNAGYGFAGAIEEASLDEVRAVLEANFFGALAVTQAVLPVFRAQRSGHVVQISSQAGIRSTPGFGVYNAAKFALEGASEALAGEVAPLGIRVTIVEPGPFRTNFAATSLAQAERVIDDYAATAGAFRQRMSQINGQQEGDPAKAAQAIVQIVEAEHPPLRLPLGKIALVSIAAKLASVQKDLDDWREVAEGAEF